MSDFLNRMKAAAKTDVKTIVLPEGEDPRTIEAAKKIIDEGLANIVILGDPAQIDVPGAQVIDPTSPPRPGTRPTPRSSPSSAPRRASPSSRRAPR